MKKFWPFLFIALFLLVCILPTATLLLGYEGENYENRPLARMPKLINEDGLNLSFPSDFDDYFEDHFGLREEMVTLFHGITMTLLGDTLNQKVVVGKNDMLFYSETLNDYLGRELLSDREIARIAACLRIEQEYVESKGAEFAFAIAPNKNTIYPEYMPDYLKPSGEKSNRERLMEALSAQGVNTIDLASKLISAKDEGLLYHYQDTHWNERGAQIGYRAIMKIAAGSASYEQYLGLTPTIKNDYGGDLHYFVLPTVKGTLARPDYGLTFEYEKDASGAGRTTTIGTTSNANERRLLLYRDSFGDALLPYLSANLGRVLYDSEFPYNYSRMEEEQPDAVIVELVERNLPNLLTKAPNLPAKETSFSGSITSTLSAAAITLRRNQSTVIAGCFNGENYDPSTCRILIRSERGNVYEAFPILEEEAESLSASVENAEGFSVTLPEEEYASRFRIILETPNGAYESELLSPAEN